MNNVNFEDGLKSFTINNDPNRVIKFNPADTGMLDRIIKGIKNIQSAVENNSSKSQNKSKQIKKETISEEDIYAIEEIAFTESEADKIIKNQIDYIFDYPVSEVVFGATSALSPVKGVPLYERFMNAIIPVIEKECKSEAEASRKRIKKYILR